MTKFIVIDNSIKDTAGHHYQYAAHCLLAGQEVGYLPILATNKRYSSPNDSQWETYAVYTYGFWERPGESWLRLLVNLKRNISSRVNQLKYKAVFSWIGYSFENRNQLFGHVRMPGEDEDLIKPIPWLILYAVAGPLYKIFMRKRNPGAIKMPIRMVDPIAGTRIRMRGVHTFAKDTDTLFRKVKLEAEDMVFIPTVGLTELFGLSEFFKRQPKSQKATWHLLFRRNIYSGRESEYWRQDENLRVLRSALFNFIRTLESENVYFYTDTEELTVQYNRLGVAPFHTLPIPHTTSAIERTEKLPLIITYIGDARTEKGYHHLPSIVGDLWSDYVEVGKARFVFQSNFNIEKGEPKIVVARSQLEAFPKDKVELIYNSLSFNEYIDLLLSSDIVLLPYERDNYYARSSGILVECLAAGIPVIVPAATWLGRQVINETYDHYAALDKTMNKIECLPGTELLWWRSDTSESDPMVNGELVCGSKKMKAYCWLSRPMYAFYLRLSFTMNSPPRSCILIEIDQLRYDRIRIKFNTRLIEKLNGEISYSILIPLENECNLMSLAFSNAFGNEVLRVSGISVTFLSPKDSSQRCPLGTIGLTYSDPSEISDLLREIIDNYLYYRESARSFAQKYSKFHNAKRLIDEIKDVVIQHSLESSEGLESSDISSSADKS